MSHLDDAGILLCSLAQRVDQDTEMIQRGRIITEFEFSAKGLSVSENHAIISGLTYSFHRVAGNSVAEPDAVC